MDAIVRGGQPPVGHVRVSGAKNSATRLLAASLLSDEAVELLNFPTQLVDVLHKIRFCRKIGADINIDDRQERVVVRANRLQAQDLGRSDLDVPIRTTYLLAAPQILRSGRARIPYPGGCPIGGGAAGGRGYDLHMMVWRALGCDVVERDDHIEISGQFVGGRIDFPITTVGGTENALICASVASGETEITNAYVTPEVDDLIALLRQMGADIELVGSSRIIVGGQGRALGGAKKSVMADRIEALTWIIYAALAGGSVTVEGVPFDAMTVPLLHLRHAGVDILCNSTSAHVAPHCIAPGGLQPFELACGAHPGIISDMQAFYVLLAVAGAGTSRIYDYRYPERIAFIGELAKLVEGDVLSAERGKITVRGPARFRPGRAGSTDLRGSMAVVIAALCADGNSVVENVHMALRGYNNLPGKLAGLGVTIDVLSDAKAA